MKSACDWINHRTGWGSGFKATTPGPCGPGVCVSSGGEETRTLDLFHAMEALYQLSYAPDNGIYPELWPESAGAGPGVRGMVRTGGGRSRKGVAIGAGRVLGRGVTERERGCTLVHPRRGLEGWGVSRGRVSCSPGRRSRGSRGSRGHRRPRRRSRRGCRTRRRGAGSRSRVRSR